MKLTLSKEAMGDGTELLDILFDVIVEGLSAVSDNGLATSIEQEEEQIR